MSTWTHTPRIPPDGVPSVEVINQALFIVLFPITFIANTFVPLESLSRPLEIFAQWNPISAITQAARNLFGNDALVTEPTVWPLQHPVAYTLIRTVIILVIFIPLTNLQLPQGELPADQRGDARRECRGRLRVGARW